MQIRRSPAKSTTTALTGAALIAFLLLGGCGGDPNAPGTPATVSLSTITPQPSARPTETPPLGAVVLSEPSAGRTFQIRRGERVVLRLHSTYWHIAPPDRRILTQTGAQKVTPAPGGTCRPGVGCGTVQATFIASATGSAKLTASRTTCGEAKACPHGQGNYLTYLVVS